MASCGPRALRAAAAAAIAVCALAAAAAASNFTDEELFITECMGSTETNADGVQIFRGGPLIGEGNYFARRSSAPLNRRWNGGVRFNGMLQGLTNNGAQDGSEWMGCHRARRGPGV